MKEVGEESITNPTDSNHTDRKSNKRILLVDDEPDIIYWAKNVLEYDNGFVVDSYTNPTLALSNFKPGLYDLLLLDIRMPEIDGFDMYEKMRKIFRSGKPFRVTGELILGTATKPDQYGGDKNIVNLSDI